MEQRRIRNEIVMQHKLDLLFRLAMQNVESKILKDYYEDQWNHLNKVRQQEGTRYDTTDTN